MLTVMQRRVAWVLPVLAAIGMAAAAYRLWRLPLPATPALPSPLQASQPPATVSPQVLARLFDLAPEHPLAHAPSALKLKASVVAGEHSRILVEHAGTVRAYGMGERLPDGSQVRAIEAGRAQLWLAGKAVVLSLASSLENGRYLTPLSSQVPQP